MHSGQPDLCFLGDRTSFDVQDGEGIVLYREADLMPCEGEAVDTVGILLIGGAGVFREDLEDRRVLFRGEELCREGIPPVSKAEIFQFG